jgi:hypothetical protein
VYPGFGNVTCVGEAVETELTFAPSSSQLSGEGSLFVIGVAVFQACRMAFVIFEVDAYK